MRVNNIRDGAANCCLCLEWLLLCAVVTQLEPFEVATIASGFVLYINNLVYSYDYAQSVSPINVTDA